MQSKTHNLITDVPGITVGHASCEKTQSGVTVLRCASPSVAAVDIRGGGPASRETDALATENLVGRVDAITLSGGSVFGLAAADGVTTALSAANIGLRLSEKSPAIPIVPGVALHDLGNDGDKNWGDEPPYRTLGAAACNAAGEQFALGSHGAGRGAMAGSCKGGVGSASVALDGIMIGALVAVNSLGAVYMPDGQTFHAWPWEQGDEFGGRTPPVERDAQEPFPPYSRIAGGTREATTLGVIAVSANLTGVEAKRVAMMAHDGLARAIRPAHTPFDGDIVFAVATANDTIPDMPAMMRNLRIAAIGAAAADCLARAIARGVYAAETA